LVNRFTNQALKESKDQIDPTNVLFKNNYTLDHRFSKFEGFKQNVPPEIIGSKWNLEPLVKSKNSSKGVKCSITLEELLQLFAYEHITCRP